MTISQSSRQRTACRQTPAISAAIPTAFFSNPYPSIHYPSPRATTMLVISSPIESQRGDSFLRKFLSFLSPRKKIAATKLPFPAHPRLTPTANRGRQPGDMARIMSRLDEDGDGKISPTELRNCMIALGEDLTLEEAESAVECVDSDGDGLLGLEDFARLAAGEWDDDERRRNLRDAFRVYEMEGEGRITPGSLKATLGRLGDARSEEECAAMIRSFDVDGDGVLSFEEFRLMMMI